MTRNPSSSRPRWRGSFGTVLLALCATACIGVPENVEKGPRVSSVELSTPAGSTSGGTLRPETDGQPYVVKIVVAVDPGAETDGDATYAPERVEVTIASNGSPVPALGAFERTLSDNGYSYLFAPAQPFTLPASQKGKSLSVRAIATDSRGLRSNITDVKVSLE